MKRRNPLFFFSPEDVNKLLINFYQFYHINVKVFDTFNCILQESQTDIANEAKKSPFFFTRRIANQVLGKLISLTNKETRKDSNVERQRNHPITILP